MTLPTPEELAADLREAAGRHPGCAGTLVLAADCIDQLAADRARLRDAASAVLQWHNRDGSVGGLSDPMEALQDAFEGNSPRP